MIYRKFVYALDLSYEDDGRYPTMIGYANWENESGEQFGVHGMGLTLGLAMRFASECEETAKP